MNIAVYAVLIAFIANVVLCPMLIPALVKFKFGQYVRPDGPKEHLKKAKTPTMGGIMIIISFLLAAMIFMRDNPKALGIIGVTLGFGVIGFLDDYTKIVKKQSLGLKAYQKILGQLIVSIAFLWYWSTLDGFSTAIIIPFFPILYLTWVFYFRFLQYSSFWVALMVQI